MYVCNKCNKYIHTYLYIYIYIYIYFLIVNSRHNLIVVNRVREMVNFGLGKEIEKDVFRLETSVEQRIILSPYEESNLRPSGSALRCSTTEPERLYGKRGLLRSSVLHTAKMSNFYSVMVVN